jgi:ribonuclease-3
MPSTTSSHDSETRASTSPSPSDALGYRFGDPTLLELALRHRSWCAENGGVESNERLEFLGDAVLGLVITDHLYDSTPTDPEGVLAQRRAELVNAVALAELGRQLSLGSALLLGKGEETTGGRDKTSILADALEALFGAVYLDGGLEEARSVILRLYRDRISDVEAGARVSDHKSRLQELAAREFGELPRYQLSETGPEHAKVFSARVRLGGEVWGEGDGRTKKEAEQSAARVAHRRLRARQDSDGGEPRDGEGGLSRTRQPDAPSGDDHA